jgi:hypothetical protein
VRGGCSQSKAVLHQEHLHLSPCSQTDSSAGTLLSAIFSAGRPLTDLDWRSPARIVVGHERLILFCCLRI